MIQVQGNVIQLIRYQVKYKMLDCMIVENFRTLEEATEIAERKKGEIVPLDVTGMEWIDGIQIPKTDMPMEAANEIVAMGEEGYKKWLEQQAAQSPEKLAEENEKLKQQLTDTQLALVEVYEMMLPS